MHHHLEVVVGLDCDQNNYILGDVFLRLSHVGKVNGQELGRNRTTCCFVGRWDSQSLWMGNQRNVCQSQICWATGVRKQYCETAKGVRKQCCETAMGVRKQCCETALNKQKELVIMHHVVVTLRADNNWSML